MHAHDRLPRRTPPKCVAVCGSVLQCVAVVCCGLQWFAVCCSVLQCVAESCNDIGHVYMPTTVFHDISLSHTHKHTQYTYTHTNTHTHVHPPTHPHPYTCPSQASSHSISTPSSYVYSKLRFVTRAHIHTCAHTHACTRTHSLHFNALPPRLLYMQLPRCIL